MKYRIIRFFRSKDRNCQTYCRWNIQYTTWWMFGKWKWLKAGEGENREYIDFSTEDEAEEYIVGTLFIRTTMLIKSGNEYKPYW